MEVEPSDENLEKRIYSLEYELNKLKNEQQKLIDIKLFQKAKKILEKEISKIQYILDKNLKTMSYEEYEAYFNEHVSLPEPL
jgi:hypothetical protein